MAEELGQEVAPVENQEVAPVVEDAGGLPSAQDEGQIDTSKWSLTDEFQEGNFKNGKLLDRFDSLEDLVAGYKEMSAKHANYVRDIKNNEKAQVEQAQAQEIQAQEAQAKESTANELASALLENNMTITPEIKAQIEESGLSVEAIENRAFKAEKMVAKAYEAVGGKEEYVAMQEWAKENLPDNVREDFDRNLSGASAEIYIKGLHAQYKMNAESTESAQPAERITGEPASVGVIKGYSSHAEMLRDVNYINGAGAGDIAAIKAHKARMAKTSDDIIYGNYL